jgi:hypothetical protein
MDTKSIAFMTPAVTPQEHMALKRLYKGEADAHQQRLALQLIVNKFSRAQETLFIPGSFAETAFLEGRGFVGQRVLKYLNLPVGKLDDINKEQSGD